MLLMYVNTVTRQWFDRDGNLFRKNSPEMPFLSRDTIKIVVCRETPDAGEENANPENWTRDNSFSGITGLDSKLTVDNDYQHKISGQLTQPASGEVTEIYAKIPDATYSNTPQSGTVRVFYGTGEYESIAFSSREFSSSGDVKFTVSATLSKNYESGATIDCDQLPFCESYFDQTLSDPENGEFVFDLAIDSSRLRSEMEYANKSTLQVAGLEIMMFKTDPGTSETQILNAFLCDTFIISGTIGSVGYEAEPPDPVKNQINSAVAILLAAGFEIETRDSETDVGGVEFRFRSASVGGNWSEWILLPRGQDGAQGQNGTGLQIDQFGLFSERPASPESYPFCYFATDTNLAYFWDGSAWSDGVTITGPAGPAGENGTDGIDGETIIADPAVEFTVLNETYGRCVQLDATTSTMNFANSVWEISSIRFRAVSANPDVTGNAVLIAIVDGVEREPVTVAVGATPGTIEIPLDPAATGQFAIKRDVSSDSDTLQDGEPVSLLLLNAEVKK